MWKIILVWISPIYTARHLLDGFVLRFYKCDIIIGRFLRAFLSLLSWNPCRIFDDHWQKPAGKKPLKVEIKPKEFVFLFEDKSKNNNQRKMRVFFQVVYVVCSHYCLIAYVALLIFFVMALVYVRMLSQTYTRTES